MNEDQFLSIWKKDKPTYEAWGKYVSEKIISHVESRGLIANSFFKVSPSYRLKDDESLVDKAFYRGKSYEDPYEEIEDKVGVRFVVLLLTDLDLLKTIVQEETSWECDECRNFQSERERDPLLFTYQSIHFILRPVTELVFEGVKIPGNVPCELQIRTLLQHAHAELTHDAIYKSQKVVVPRVLRTVAKSMALIETADDFFVETTKSLHFGKLEQHNVDQRLDSLYTKMVGKSPHNQKSAIIIWDTFENFIDGNLVDNIDSELEKIDGLGEIINKRYNTHTIYRQSIVLFVYWMLKRRLRRLVEDWPLSREILQFLANDLGITLERD